MKHQRGVTLVELLTVISIVAILGTIAVSSYRSYGYRTNRTEGQSALLKIQVGEEKYFLQNNTYTANIAAAPPVGLGVPIVSTNGYYTLAVVAGATGTLANSFLATATAAGNQVGDSATCLVFTIDDQGQRTPADATGCWK